MTPSGLCSASYDFSEMLDAGPAGPGHGWDGLATRERAFARWFPLLQGSADGGIHPQCSQA